MTRGIVVFVTRPYRHVDSKPVYNVAAGERIRAGVRHSPTRTRATPFNPNRENAAYKSLGIKRANYDCLQAATLTAAAG